MPIIGQGEPWHGSRKREVKDMLKAALRDTHVKMVDERTYDCVGLQYTDEFASYLEVLSALSLLPWKARVAIVRNLGEERASQVDIAEDMGVTRETVSRWVNAGLEEIVERVYREG